MSAEVDFADRKFKVECNQMVLTKNGGTSIVVRGPGEIWQDEDAIPQYKIFADQPGYRALFAHLSRPTVVGQLIPDEDFFTLEVQDYLERHWTAQRVFPSARGGPFEGLICGYLPELVHADAQAPNPDSDFVALRFRGRLKFPRNQVTETVTKLANQNRYMSRSLDAAIIKDGDYTFEVVHESEHTIVSVEMPAGQLTPFTPSRVHEALQFVLGQELALMVVETNAGGQRLTRLASPSRGHGKLLPPLHFETLDVEGHFWRIFSKYFRHVHQNLKAGWHPMSRHVSSVIEAGAAALEIQALVLAVAVEGLAAECFPAIAPVNPDFLRELDDVQRAIQGVRLGQASRERIIGTLKTMRSARNSDRIRAFIAQNQLPGGLYQSWNILRNTAAHGRDVATQDIAAILRLKAEVLSLLYSLVFAAINHTGARTDYSETGWPNRPWPVRQSAAPAPGATPTTTPVVPQPPPSTLAPAAEAALPTAVTSPPPNPGGST